MYNGLSKVYLSNQKEESIGITGYDLLNIVLTEIFQFLIVLYLKLVLFLYYRQSMVWCGRCNFNDVLQNLDYWCDCY